MFAEVCGRVMHVGFQEEHPPQDIATGKKIGTRFSAQISKFCVNKVIVFEFLRWLGGIDQAPFVLFFLKTPNHWFQGIEKRFPPGLLDSHDTGTASRSCFPFAI